LIWSVLKYRGEYSFESVPKLKDFLLQLEVFDDEICYGIAKLRNGENVPASNSDQRETNHLSRNASKPIAK